MFGKRLRISATAVILVAGGLQAAQQGNLEVLDVKIDPIRRGKNVVRVEVKNNSSEDQMLRIQIQTQSPEIGGWGTSFFDVIQAGETIWTRHACKIRGAITDGTYIRLDFHNPGPTADFDMQKWWQKIGRKERFKRLKYDSSDLERYKADESQIKLASKSEADTANRTLRLIQDYIKSKGYEAAWGLFTQDFREAEFQISGFERFKKCMESPQRFYLSSKDFISLEPKSVSKMGDILTLTAEMKGKLWGKTRIVNFRETEGKWKIDSIEIGAVTKIDSDKRKDAMLKKMVEGQAESEIEVSDVEFETIRQGKNVLRMKIQNNSDKDQTFGVDIRAEAPIRNWQRKFLDTIKAGETKSKSFDFEILGPITDDVSIRLRFYNPPSTDEFDINNWFKQIKYTYNDLDQLGIVQDKSEPASKSQAQAVTNTFKYFQSYLKEGKYEAAWRLLAKHIRSGQFQDDFEKFREQFSDDAVKAIFLNLHPESVTKSGKSLTLSAKDGEQIWKIHFITEDGQWKIYEGQEPDRSDWQERLLPTMQKRTTKHFDIYYFKDSTAEEEIEKIAEEKENGFEKICRFLGKDSDQKIKMILFEDGQTKRAATGHQGAGWAFGNTIVEIYNEKEKLDPYHETVHVLMRPNGNPPALFNEGFAVYMSERLGAHALDDLSGGQTTIYERVRELKEKGELIDLRELLGYAEIGSGKTNPPVAYPQAASFVKFLIDQYGKGKFLNTYRTLQNSDSEAVRQENIRTLEQIYGTSLADLDEQWEEAFSS
jgi:hypothetical protein